MEEYSSICELEYVNRAAYGLLLMRYLRQGHANRLERISGEPVVVGDADAKRADLSSELASGACVRSQIPAPKQHVAFEKG